jgi:3-dehydroquinate synthase
MAAVREQRLDVTTPEGSYPIRFVPGAVSSLATVAARYQFDAPGALVTNPTVANLYGQALAAGLPNAHRVLIPDGEQHKTLETVAELYRRFAALRLDRDTAGFAAATYLRGVRLVQMPTSLLAMVDSSVGGKVGVDLPEGKNLIGAFKQPDQVVIDPLVLQTLPELEVRYGMAEAIKHGLIGDPELFEALIDLHRPPNWLDDHILNPPHYFERLAQLLPRIVAVKVGIVEQDPYEQHVRAYLNLGHTFAHAIEQVSGYTWAHGAAVGVGLVAAARLSYALGACSVALVEQVEAGVAAIGLRYSLPYEAQAVYEAMGSDKKRKGGKLRFVLLEALGKPALRDDVPAAAVHEVLQGLNP